MNYQVYNILELFDSKEEYQKYIMKNFGSNINGDTETQDFLFEKSYDWEKENKSRTYLLIGENHVTELLGFFSITVNKINFASYLPRKIRKKINASKCKDDKTNETVFCFSSYLIGQLSRNNMKYNKNEISGDEILMRALEKIKQAFEVVGGNVITVDCVDNLIPFYEKFGFIKIAKRNNLNQMYISIDNV